MDAQLAVLTAARVVVAYVVVIAYIRVSGDRTLAKMRAFDFVVTIALGTLLANAIIGPGPLWQALLAIGLLLLQWTVAKVGVASAAFNDLVTNEGIRIFHDGSYDEDAMRKARVRREEAEGAIRSAGLRGAKDVKEIWLEVNGDISVVKRT